MPLVGLAPDANLLWDGYRCLRRCDLVLADAPTVEAVHREGVPQARAVNLFGLDRTFPAGGPAATNRDIDILFIGNCHPAVQHLRLELRDATEEIPG